MADDTQRTKIRNIAELAALAGVSAGTVSRALSGTGLISTATRERIRALAREHDFRPNTLARNLRIQRTGAIGVVIPLGHEQRQHISDPFFMTMLGLLADALTERDYELILSRVIPTDTDWLHRIAMSGRVDGVIVIGQSDQGAVIDRVARDYPRLVVWGQATPGQHYASVGTDNVAGGTMAAAHLIARGSRRLAFFGDPAAVEIGARLDGVRTAMRDAGLAADALTVFPAHLVAEDARPAIAAFLEGADPLPDGIVAASDVVAMSALGVLADRGVQVPGDVRVVGYDDILLAQYTVPQLTTVAQDFRAGAAAMVDVLMARTRGEDAASVVMPPRLVERAST